MSMGQPRAKVARQVVQGVRAKEVNKSSLIFLFLGGSQKPTNNEDRRFVHRFLHQDQLVDVKRSRPRNEIVIFRPIVYYDAFPCFSAHV